LVGCNENVAKTPFKYNIRYISINSNADISNETVYYAYDILHNYSITMLNIKEVIKRLNG
jgi:hypothetical protein